jgi:amino-acid N-acetyltransferase
MAAKAVKKEKKLAVEKAKISDAPQIHKLANHFAQKGVMLPRALSEIYENIRDFFVIREGDKVVACAALHVYWSDLAEVRGVAVAEELQNQRLGAKLIEACISEARELGIPQAFCLTYRASFFERQGFKRVDKSELPRKIWSECYRCPKFPDCDEVAMTYRVE